MGCCLYFPHIQYTTNLILIAVTPAFIAICADVLAAELSFIMEKVRFGIIGIGGMGSIHANYLKNGEIEGAVLSAVCDIKESRKEWAKENLPEA